MPAPEHDAIDPTGGSTSTATTEATTVLPARRSVIQAAAWAAPLVAVAVATPLAAASGDRGTIAFTPASIIAASGAQQRAVSGTVSPAVDAVVLMMTYSAGFGGPRFVTTTAGTGAFSLGIRCPVGSGVSGTASASAADFATGTVALTTTSPRQGTGTISFTYDSTTGTASAGTASGGTAFADTASFVGVTGSLSVTAGNLLPDSVELEYAPGFTGPASASVVKQPGSTTLGTFTVSGVTAAAGSASPAPLKATPADFQGIVTYTPTVATTSLTL